MGYPPARQVSLRLNPGKRVMVNSLKIKDFNRLFFFDFSSGNRPGYRPFLPNLQSLLTEWCFCTTEENRGFLSELK